jgi:hypothetical protein
MRDHPESDFSDVVPYPSSLWEALTLLTKGSELCDGVADETAPFFTSSDLKLLLIHRGSSMTIVSTRSEWWRQPVRALLITISIHLSISVASAHDWYPMECCSGTDCAEVEHATYDRASDTGNKLPILSVTTKHGTALVPENFPHRESMDGKMHACMRPGQGDMRLICLFVPPPS